MLWLLIALLVSIAIIGAALKQMRRSHTELKERFQAEDALMEADITEDDKYMYFLIIDMFQENLNREPQEDELIDMFARIKNKDMTLADVYRRIVDSEEYMLLNPSRPVPELKIAQAPNVSDYDAVYAMLLEEMPDKKEIFYETSKDSGYMSYILTKYVANDRDLEKTREFVRRTPEYIDARADSVIAEATSKALAAASPAPTDTAATDTAAAASTTDAATAATSATQYDDPIEDPITDDVAPEQFLFARPHVGQTTMRRTARETHQCMMYAESQRLSERRTQRDLDTLRHKCEASLQYDNVAPDLTLLPDQTWSVPQKRTPVCHSTNCTVHDPYAQSALLGTVLHEAENDRIMPEFTYSEAA